MKWDRERWDRELALIQKWRSEQGMAFAHAQRCLEGARAVLTEHAPDWMPELAPGYWRDHSVMEIALAWHPSRSIVESEQGGFLTWPDDPREGSGVAYCLLERHGGIVSGPLAKYGGWATGTDARMRFTLISAALVIFEAHQVVRAGEARDLSLTWCAYYWLTRFHRNMERARMDTIQRKRAGGRGGGAKVRQADANKTKVQAAYGRLLPEQRGRGMVGQICEATNLSRPTVSAHLKALGLIEKPEN